MLATAMALAIRCNDFNAPWTLPCGFQHKERNCHGSIIYVSGRSGDASAFHRKFDVLDARPSFVVGYAHDQTVRTRRNIELIELKALRGDG
jgi:hypothetical protein